MPYATCPQCDSQIHLPGTPDIGDIVRCRTCETRLEVVDLDPIELDWPWEPDDEDDEGDEDEYSDGFQVWDEDDEELDDDDDDDHEDGLDLDYAAYDDDDDFSYSRIKHLDN